MSSLIFSFVCRSGWEKSKKHVTAAFLASISSGIDSGRTAGTLDMHADAVRKVSNWYDDSGC